MTSLLRLLQRGGREARSDDVLFVGLNMQDITEDAHAFLREFQIDYLNIRDPSNEIARRYGVTGVPETYFISAKSEIVGHVIGVVNTTQLRDGIKAAVAGKPLAAEQGGEQKPTR